MSECITLAQCKHMQTQHAPRHTTYTDAAPPQRLMKPAKVRLRVNKWTLIVCRTGYRPQGMHARAVSHVSLLLYLPSLIQTYKEEKTQGMHGAQVAHISPCSLVDGGTDAPQGVGSGTTVVAEGGTAHVPNAPSCPLSTNTPWSCASSSPRRAPVCL